MAKEEWERFIDRLQVVRKMYAEGDDYGKEKGSEWLNEGITELIQKKGEGETYCIL